MKKLFNTVALVIIIFGFVGCSKSDGDSSPVNTKEALKVTVTASAAYTTNGSDVRVSVNSADDKGKPMPWTVNGVAGTEGQILHNVNKEYFEGGKTAILQSKPNYLSALVTISAFSITTPFSLYYKIEKGDKVIVEKTEMINVNVTPLTVSLTY